MATESRRHEARDTFSPDHDVLGHLPTGQNPLTVTRVRLTRLVLGLILVFGLFQWTATGLGSDHGQAGLIVSAIVATATLAVQRVWFAPSLGAAIRELGLGLPR